MWQGKDLSQAWANQIGKGDQHSAVAGSASLAQRGAQPLLDTVYCWAGDASYVDLDFPAFPETFGDAHIRYTEALQASIYASACHVNAHCSHDHTYTQLMPKSVQK